MLDGLLTTGTQGIGVEITELSPIVVFAYNRPGHLESCLEALSRNPEARRSRIKIIVYGAKGPEDSQWVLATVQVARHKSPSPLTEIVERPRNLGLAKSIIDGVTRALTEWDTVIVIEDDLLVAPGFLAFMNASLKIYEHENAVVSVHGYVPPLRRSLEKNFFLPGADCWGWATWRSGWAVFEPSGSKLLKALTDQNLRREFNYDESFPFFEMLEDQVAGKNNSWAIRWQASAFLEGKMTYHPARSLVQNTGFDGTGTHGGESSRWDTAVGAAPPPVSARIEIDEEILGLYREFYQSISAQVQAAQIEHPLVRATQKMLIKMMNRFRRISRTTEHER